MFHVLISDRECEQPNEKSLLFFFFFFLSFLSSSKWSVYFYGSHSAEVVTTYSNFSTLCVHVPFKETEFIEYAAEFCFFLSCVLLPLAALRLFLRLADILHPHIWMFHMRELVWSCMESFIISIHAMYFARFPVDLITTSVNKLNVWARPQKRRTKKNYDVKTFSYRVKCFECYWI